MNIDQQQELDSREQIRRLVEKHADQFGNDSAILFLSVIMLEYCLKYEWENGKPLDLYKIMINSKEVAFWNASSELNEM